MSTYTTITSFTDVIEHIIPGTLVVLDLDETVFKFDGISHPTWWKNTYEKYLEIHGSHEAADDASLREWNEKVGALAAKHTDEYGLYKFMQDVEDAGNMIVALTARSGDMIEMTERHVDDIGIKFNDVNIKDSTIANQNGIFYIGHGNNKGDAIVYILDKINENYENSLKRVVFIDDVVKHIQTACESINVSKYVGYMYLAEFT